jgi:hypothetical protein
MKTRLLTALTAVIFLLIPMLNFAQAPPLGTAANFVLFSTVGAVGNTGISQITGNVGTNSGAITGFGNVNGQMHTGDGATGSCAADLLLAYDLLNSAVPTFFPAPLLGNGQILIAGIYSISGAATLNGTLILNAQGNASAVFIIQIQGPFSTAANSKVKLINGALACNVFWKVEGLISMAPGTAMKGTVIANNAAINMSVGDTLEGRALSTTGAVNVTGVLAYTPIGCGSPVLMGPAAPGLNTVACYAIFSADGPVSNAGITNVTGDVGTNVGLTTGFNPLFVTGMIHAIPDGSTLACAADLGNVYAYLNSVPYDIELLYPAQFGHNLVLTPHTYIMNAATSLTDTLYLNAQGSADAVFIIKIYGALSTSSYSKVVLINGTQSKNVYWLVSGAVTISDYSIFRGTLICNNGAILLSTGANIDGRMLSTTGAVGTTAITDVMPINGCGGFSNPNITLQPIASQTVCSGTSVNFSVTATGTGLTYQWRIGTVNLVDGGNISGATSEMLTLNPVNTTDAASNYNVVVSGTYLPGVTSNDAALTVNASPVPVISGVFNMCINSGYFNYTTETGMTNYQWVVSPGGVINYGSGTSQVQVSWIISGPQTISVNYASASGCNALAPTVSDVTVNAAPDQAGPITGTSAVCSGASGPVYSVAQIPNATAYSWTLSPDAVISSGMGTNSITVNYGTNAVSGNISVSGNNLCGNGAVSPNFAVVVTPVPVAPVVTNIGYILYSDAPTGNQWYFEGTLIAGATSQTYDATLSGTGNYSCVVTLNGCSSDASISLLVIVTGVDSHLSAAVNVYPVPNNGQFTVSIISSSPEPFTISIYSTQGIKIFEITDIHVDGNFNQNINLGSFSDGIYTVVIRNSSSYTTKKVTIKQ